MVEVTETYGTADLAEAAFLRCRGQPLLRVTPGDSWRVLFIFPQAAQALAADYANDAPVPVQSFAAIFKTLKGLAIRAKRRDGGFSREQCVRRPET